MVVFLGTEFGFSSVKLRCFSDLARWDKLTLLILDWWSMLTQIREELSRAIGMIVHSLSQYGGHICAFLWTCFQSIAAFPFLKPWKMTLLSSNALPFRFPITQVVRKEGSGMDWVVESCFLYSARKWNTRKVPVPAPFETQGMVFTNKQKKQTKKQLPQIQSGSSKGTALISLHCHSSGSSLKAK